MNQIQLQAKMDLLTISAALEGAAVTSIRFQTEEEAEEVGWHARPIVICFDNGTEVWATRDPEGNGPGCIEVKQPKSGFLLGAPVPRNL
tara:strand:- start:7036 stop:7302 length:267 start_codon:yes stop_codon:yes gene_type:complete